MPARRDAATSGDVLTFDVEGAGSMTTPRMLEFRRDKAAELVRTMDAAIDCGPKEPTRERPVPLFLPRGVHTAPWLDLAGNPVIVAVRSDHRVIAWLPWEVSRTYHEITDELWYVLNAVDPV